MTANNFKHIKLDHKKMGFDPGDDDKLQAAMHKNLHAAAKEAAVSGDVERQERVTEDMNAIERLRERDKILDPNDESPDHPIGGYKASDL